MRRAADVDDDRRTAPRVTRANAPDEPMDANPLQPDRVQHACRRLDDPGRGMTLSLVEEESLDGDSAEVGKVHDVAILDAVPEASAGRDERVLQRQRADGDRQIHESMLTFPHERARVEHGSARARSDVMRLPVAAMDLDDAAVAAAHAASHDVRPTPRSGRPALTASRATAANIGSGHTRRAAPAPAAGCSAVERHRNASELTPAAVFRGKHDADAQRLEQIEADRSVARAAAVEKRQADATRAQRLGERDERRQADTASNHPGLGRAVHQRERATERTQTRPRARPRFVQQRRVGPILLLRSERPVGAPLVSRRISKMENGRRSSGSKPGCGLTMTNCPGSAAAATSGASRAITL